LFALVQTPRSKTPSLLVETKNNYVARISLIEGLEYQR
jgi:hypothetical protein